jgi:hypothetical protein
LDDTAMVDFLAWALPEVMYELGKAAAAADAAAEGKRAAAARQGLQFAPCKVQMQPAGNRINLPRSNSHNSSSSSSLMLTGELQLGGTAGCGKLLAGRSVVAVAYPPTPAYAVAAAAAISAAAAAAAAGVSAHLLLSCCSPVAMSAEAALKEHGIAGWGCLCIWDLKAQQQQQQQQVTAASGGLVQLLVSEGQPSCCCWGTGAGSSLVFAGKLWRANYFCISDVFTIWQLHMCRTCKSAAYGVCSDAARRSCQYSRMVACIRCCWPQQAWKREACAAGTFQCLHKTCVMHPLLLPTIGMEEGGLCCWDLSEPDKLHQPQQQQQHPQDSLQQRQQQQLVPARRPSYSTELPFTAGSSDSSWVTPERPARADFISSSTTNLGSTCGTSCTAFALGLGSTDSIVAIAVLEPTEASRAGGSSSAAVHGGAGCQLVSLSAAGNVAMFSVMLGAAAGGVAAEFGVGAAAADLGTRAGERLSKCNMRCSFC